jgi:SAM-dependent methyltransferase
MGGESIRLNLGCGGRPLAGYINVDRDSLDQIRARYPGRAFDDGLVVENHDIFNLPFAADSVDEVRADSLIEHLAFVDEPRFFLEVVRVLRPGGLLSLTTVDFEAVARQWLAAKDDWKDFYRTDDEAILSQHWFGTYSYGVENRWGYLTATIFGSQNGPGQFHTNCYSEAKLRAICRRLHLEVETVDRFQWHGDRDHMLALSARKRG